MSDKDKPARAKANVVNKILFTKFKRTASDVLYFRRAQHFNKHKQLAGHSTSASLEKLFVHFIYTEQ